MPREDKSTVTDKQKRAADKSPGQKGSTAPAAQARGWAAANQLHGGGKKIAARRKLPSGPLGGSGRKTNQARSS